MCLVTGEVNVTQRKPGYLQAQERLLGKTEMPKPTGGVEDLPLTQAPTGKALCENAQQWPALGIT